MKQYKREAKIGELLDKGRIVTVNHTCAEVLIDGEAEPIAFSLEGWRKFHAEPVIGQRVNVVSVGYNAEFGFSYYSFLPEGFVSKFNPETDIKVSEGKLGG